MAEDTNSRRQFLRNTALAGLGLGALPALASGELSLHPNAPTPESCNKTTADYYGEGPFYRQNPPLLSNGQLAPSNEPGERMIISGRVQTLDCLQVIPNTVVDVWHANDAGQYDNTGYSLRGVVKSNAQGFYLFETIRPGKYLNGNSYRPSHIHFKVTPPSFPTLTTQLYFQGDSSIAGDAAASITSGPYDARDRIIPLTQNNQQIWEGTWDITIDGSGVSVGMHDLHLERGMIYGVSPNPAQDELTISYGVFRSARIGLHVYDLSGREVACLQEQDLSPQKYSAHWQVPSELVRGHFFVALKVNDQQVHYQKITLV